MNPTGLHAPAAHPQQKRQLACAGVGIEIHCFGKTLSRMALRQDVQQERRPMAELLPLQAQRKPNAQSGSADDIPRHRRIMLQAVLHVIIERGGVAIPRTKFGHRGNLPAAAAMNFRRYEPPR